MKRNQSNERHTSYIRNYKRVEIQYNEFIKSKSKSTGSLFLPRFVEVREDKNTATSYEEIVT